jgi:hypothetical protein
VVMKSLKIFLSKLKLPNFTARGTAYPGASTMYAPDCRWPPWSQW